MTTPIRTKTQWILAGVLVLGVLFLIFQTLSKGLSGSVERQPATESLTVEPMAADFMIGGWLPDWAAESGLQSLQTNQDLFTSVSPVWYAVESDGSLLDKKPSNSGEVLEITRSKRMEVTPSIPLFDHEILSDILQDPENLERHVQQVVQAGSETGVHGIDLDYESTKLADKDKFFEFLERVSAGLKQNNKKLVVTVLPKWGEQVVYTSLKETRQVQDWKRIGAIADEVRIMAYDYTWQSSPFSGPIAPLSWHRDILDYAITQIPRDKIVLSIHLYAYEKWVEREKTADMGNFEDPQLKFVRFWWENTGDSRPGRAYTYQTVSRVLAEYNGTDEEFEGEKIHRYSKVNDTTKTPEDRIMVYIDADGVQQRIDLAKDYGIKGVAFWRLGGEGDMLSRLRIET